MNNPRDTLDDVRFSELVSDGSDFPGVAERLKSIAAAEREMGRETTVDELLAQSRRVAALFCPSMYAPGACPPKQALRSTESLRL
ncbi:hypothetical protein [Halorubrum sp. CSM-61]|uniref:hypothetical protein n=1 Tax=Halorubrum sp. CSM-61 TaxID=2485838 RepID=UPI000F4D14CB|nr:hypothetical protein [Halorubrum sp. CSM-61]